MPSAAHEVLVAILGDQPELLALLVEKLVGRELQLPLAKIDSAVRFTDPEEIRPDIVLRGERQPWVIAEVQGEADEAKARRWPLAAAALLDQTGAMGDVVVITYRSRVAKWARRVAHLKGPLGTELILCPLVLLIPGDALDALLDERHPALAVLAAWGMQHRHGPRARKVVTRAFELSNRLPEPLRATQVRAIYNVLNERMRASLEADVDRSKIDTPEAYRFVEKWDAYQKALREAAAQAEHQKALREAAAQAEARGEARGEKRGEKRGQKRGEARGEAKALLTLLKARGLTISRKQRTRVLACEDVAQLDRWIRQAATARSAAAALA